MFHIVSKNRATIRELRVDFRSVKRRIEEHGEVIITDRGQPAYIIKSLAPPPHRQSALPDYHARLLRRQPKGLSPEQTRLFWDQERR